MLRIQPFQLRKSPKHEEPNESLMSREKIEARCAVESARFPRVVVDGSIHSTARMLGQLFTKDRLRHLSASYGLAEAVSDAGSQIAKGVSQRQIARMASLDGFEAARKAIQARTLDYSRMVNIASAIRLPDALEAYRISDFSAAAQLTQARFDLAHLARDAVEAFHASSAVAQVLSAAKMIGSHELTAISAFTHIEIPDSMSTVSTYGRFLSSAGLWVNHWPHTRLLSHAERRRRLKQRMHAHRPSVEQRRAYDLIFRYEMVLREVIDCAMEDHYGEEWHVERLPLCGCKDLLGRWEKRGGAVLDHADFPHYSRIIADAEHFAAIFHVAFETTDIASDQIDRVRRLRTESFHPGHVFTIENLRELRLVLRQIEVAMLALTPEHEVIWRD
jgi:hypothetical protein